MPKSIGLKIQNGQQCDYLVAHLKRVRDHRDPSPKERMPDWTKTNTNVQAVLKVLEDIYLKK